MTIFAPTDDAFDQLPRQAVDELFNDPNALVDLLTKHVVKSTLLSPSLTFKELETAGGQNINVKVRRGRVFIEDARLIDGKKGVLMYIVRRMHVVVEEKFEKKSNTGHAQIMWTAMGRGGVVSEMSTILKKAYLSSKTVHEGGSKYSESL